MYHFRAFEENNVHFWFKKNLITDMNWSKLPPASKSIYPVIVCHRNAQWIAFPSEETIAALAGVTAKTARTGINGLNGFPGIEIQPYTTTRGRRSKKFWIEGVIPIKGRAFPVFKSIFTGGNWSQLTPTAQALYPVMRAFSFFDGEECFEEGEPNNSDEYMEEYKERPFDICTAEICVLAEKAGITRRSVYSALSSLEKNGLIEKTIDIDAKTIWHVYLRPKYYFKRSYLNQVSHRKINQV